VINKKRIFEILEIASAGDVPSKIFDVFIMTLISLNVIAVILETEPSLASYKRFFNKFEVFSVVVFSIEYLLRIWTCTSDKRFKHPLKGRIRFAVTPLALIDLLAVLPFYLPMVIPLDLRSIRALRLFRFVRLLKIGRYSESLRSLGYVLKKKEEELIVTVIALLMLLVITSSIVYFLEHEAQPKVFSSIPAAMWWGVATLTTVGYGDVCPITTLGKCFGALIAILGIGMFALPAGIVASGFAEAFQRRRRTTQICPHCGKNINEQPKKANNNRKL